MELEQFLKQTVALDLETDENGEIYAIGAAFGDRVFSRHNRFTQNETLRALDEFAAPAHRVLGHNLLGHDLPVLKALAPNLALLQKPVVDTLYLSPLAFPENPYHRLVKDYKLVRDSYNDPVADARLAVGVFRDQWERLATLHDAEPEVLDIYRYCLYSPAVGSGLATALEAIGARPIQAARAFANLQAITARRVCSTGFSRVLVLYLPDPIKRVALAYCVAWLRVAGGHSVLPPWVRHRFNDVAAILRQLRDIPCDDRQCDYCRQTHDPLTQLRRYFGFPVFRAEPATPSGASLQQAITRHAMADQPLLAILPTGGGKSLCYQLPALVRHQRRGLLTIVISPLQALMKDQVDSLREKTGAPSAAALYGMLTAPERSEVLQGIRLGDVGLLYVSPEQLRNRSFEQAIAHREIACWVFDEAHCLSKWGHDFRPDYLYAVRFIKEFAAAQKTPPPPVQCFTATAKEDVKHEILDVFRREPGQELTVFEAGVQRDNLRFEVQTVNRAEKYPRIHALLHERLAPQTGGSALVYCATRSATEAVAEYLRQQGWGAAAFHAGLDAPVKRRIQEEFIAGTTPVICATNAFGMGIDKDDVRLVVHAEIPGSLENYLQEAGRAGRDRQDAECVLLYDEQDIEGQFRLSGFSELSQHDIAQILRGLRAGKRNRDGEVVLTAGELLRSDRVQTSFDTAERNANTKVVTAIAWLERAGFLRRNQNRTRVFQGRPRVKNLAEGQEKIARLGLSERQQQRWLAILSALMNAAGDSGLSADELAESSAFSRDQDEHSRDRENETETQRVLRTLHDMAAAGLIDKGLLLSAFVRHKVKNPSKTMLERICTLERALLDLLREEAPDAEDGAWQSLSLRRLNQCLLDQGLASNPQTLRILLQSLSQDGRGLAGRRGSLNLRYAGQDCFRVKLQRDWPALTATAELRRRAAGVVLAAILERIPKTAPASAELLVEFAAEDLLNALKNDLALGAQLKDPPAALERALMFLHEQRVIALEQGLAVFRQAMTIRIFPEQKGRRYSKADYEPLARFYRERIFQIHVINEYAKLGLEKIGQALALIVAYFSRDKAAFSKRYFANRQDIISRATGEKSYRRIVEDLADPAQIAVVTAGEQDNMLILAGPGSGKTRVVVHRCAYLLRVKRVHPESVLVLCFNRNATNALRRRLGDLIGADAYGVTVQTYHGLALRLSGHSLAARAQRPADGSLDFDALLKEAVALLQGDTEVPGLEPDELRDRLLAGYRYILVDEYQDIDEDQYQLVSAIAGRTQADPDRRLGILAVGDDDQNIYQFRGANVAFIRRFQQDYQARSHYLVENYRSSGHIVAAANELIERNRDRMKTDQAIRVNATRADLDPGGDWARLDPLTRGRVQCLQIEDESHQAQALVNELARLRQLQPGVAWSECAVLTRQWSLLGPIRALCEEREIPVSMTADAEQQPSPFRIRENRLFLELLKAAANELRTAAQLEETLARMSTAGGENSWWRQLREILGAWKTETGNQPAPVGQTIEFVCESLAEQRRERRTGDGVFLSSAHAAKGMEFAHVFIPDGGWDRADGRPRQEEERRLFYVAMTRARETLCLCERADIAQGFTRPLQGDYLIRRPAPMKQEPSPAFFRRYVILGMKDLDLGYAGRQQTKARVHRAAAVTQTGDLLVAESRGGKILLLHDGAPIAALSRRATEVWRDRLGRIETISVLAMIQRRRQDGEEVYRTGYRTDSWEIPLAEVIVRTD